MRFSFERNHSHIYEEETPSHYFSQERGVDYRDYEENAHLRVKEPIPRNSKYGEPQRYLDAQELHWRNTPYLLEYVNSMGMIIPRTHTRLSIPDQKRIAKVIRYARRMHLLPTHSFVQQHHKIPLRSFEDDLLDSKVRKVDLESGAIYVEERSNEEWVDQEDT